MATKKKQKKSSVSLVGKMVIVRAHTAGVHAGVVSYFDAATNTIQLKRATRLWRIYTRESSGSISDVAAFGLKLPLNQHSIGAVLPSVTITEGPDKGLEIAEMTEGAFQTLLDAAAKA